MRIKAVTREEWLRRYAGCLFFIIGISGLTMPAAAQPAVTVGVSILPQKYFVQRIAGDYANVMVLVGQGYSPATYEPKPRQLSQLRQASVFFLIGVPFEARWTDTFASVNPTMRVVSLVRDMPLLTLTDAPGEPLHTATGDAQRHGATLDPHVWLSPPRVKEMARTIMTELVAVDSGHRDVYEANYRQFIAELDELDRWIRQQLSGIEQRRFLVFHPSWGYFAQQYGLQQVAIEHQGKSPAAKSLSNIIAIARQQHIKVIFVQRQFSQRDAVNIARLIGARVIQVDPLAEDYMTNLRSVTKDFVEAMQ